MLTTIPELHPKLLLFPPYNLSDEHLAELIGVSLPTIKSWKYGTRVPQTAMKKLCYLVSLQLQPNN